MREVEIVSADADATCCAGGDELHQAVNEDTEEDAPP
jgi:hypothetical protein